MFPSGSKQDILSYCGRKVKKKRNEDFDYSDFESKHPRLLNRSYTISKNQNDDNNDSNIMPKGNM